MTDNTATPRARADLGFDDPLDNFDPSDWAVGQPTRNRPDSSIARQAAEATGFRSREAKPAASAPAATPPAPAAQGRAAATPPRRRRTGRNAQFNLKARPETIQSFCAVADANGWGLGETLEHAVVLLEREYGAKNS